MRFNIVVAVQNTYFVGKYCVIFLSRPMYSLKAIVCLTILLGYVTFIFYQLSHLRVFLVQCFFICVQSIFMLEVIYHPLYSMNNFVTDKSKLPQDGAQVFPYMG